VSGPGPVVPGTPVPARVGVLGGGRMGSGIVHAFLLAGAEVVLVDTDRQATSAGAARVGRAVDASVERGTLTEARDAVLARLTTGEDAGAFARCGLVVEAVPESVELKQRVLADISGAVEATCLLATNTSSLPVTDLAVAVAEPGRFVGLHFFNPVPASDLVEVVVGAGTDPATTVAAEAIVAALGKTAVTVRDSPGFATSRLGLALGLEAIRMVEEGVADAADIDIAMELGYRHPVGPLRLTDLVGLDVRLGVADHLAATLGDRFRAPDLLRDKVAAGDLGRKTGRGFHDW
jgi:3-hydroxybutyryl-CoA dehydrogenase